MSCGSAAANAARHNSQLPTPSCTLHPCVHVSIMSAFSTHHLIQVQSLFPSTAYSSCLPPKPYLQVVPIVVVQKPKVVVCPPEIAKICWCAQAAMVLKACAQGLSLQAFVWLSLLACWKLHAGNGPQGSSCAQGGVVLGYPRQPVTVVLSAHRKLPLPSPPLAAPRCTEMATKWVGPVPALLACSICAPLQQTRGACLLNGTCSMRMQRRCPASSSACTPLHQPQLSPGAACFPHLPSPSPHQLARRVARSRSAACASPPFAGDTYGSMDYGSDGGSGSYGECC